MNSIDPTTQIPKWWTTSHASGWDRVKEALRRDWEQTKADLGANGSALNQDVGNTVRQALGKESIPLENVPNPESPRWEDVEAAVRYGYGARVQFGEMPEWDEEMETRLRQEWEGMGPGRVWHDVRQFVHRGWMGP